jgi:hypothetical protein
VAITLYADATDVRNAFEGTIPDDTKTNARLDSLIRRACAKLSQLVPSLDRRMSNGEIDPEIPTGMVVEAVLRVWRNPAGAVQQGVGPFQLSLNQRAAQNEIVFDRTEIDWLMGEGGMPGQFRVRHAGRQIALEPLVDADRPLNIAIHRPGL